MPIQRAILKATIASVVQIRNMLTCEVSESGGDTSAILWDAYVNSFLTAITGVMSEQVVFYEYEVVEYSAGSWTPIDVVSINVNGDVTGAQLLNAAAMVLIGKASGLRHVGRKFIGALAELSAEGNTIASGYVASAAASLVAYITPFTGIGGGTITPGVVDKTGTFHAFVGGFVSSLLGTMRRRKPGVGL